MRKLLYLFFIALAFSSCDSDDSTSVPAVLGNSYLRTSYVLQTPVDGNGDGTFSTDLYQEFTCSTARLTFQATGAVQNPLNSVVFVQVVTDFNQVPTQSITCVEENGLPTQFEQSDSEIRILLSGDVQALGELSSDGSTITFTIPRSGLTGFGPAGSDNILDSNGNAISYNGNAVITYTRQ
jgi:hypothetical protein